MRPGRRIALVGVVTIVALVSLGVGAGSATAAVAYRSVSFVDAQRGWATGMTDTYPVQSVLMKTINGGVTWQRQATRPPINGGGLSVHFMTRQRGVWVATFLYVTADGGRHWTRKTVSGATWAGWASMDFLNERVGWIGGASGGDGSGRVIAQTIDGGATWRAQIADDAAELGAVGAISAPSLTDVYALSDGLWGTRDGGATWDSIGTGATDSTSWGDVCFATPRLGWAVSARGAILATVDGGAHWTAQRRGSRSGYYDIDTVSTSTVWVVGAHGTILRTRNGGKTWVSLSSGTTKNLWTVQFINASHGWVAGNAGCLLRTANGGRTWKGSR
jgi:photosystem II stability/assembly factor-like uncharacterized protein